jgi:hypothetical protein
MQDLTFVLGPNRTGSEVWEHLGAADINIEAACMFPRLEGRVVHVTVNDADADVAHQRLANAGFTELDRRPVVIASFIDEPGALGALTQRINDAGITIYLMYMATGDRVVIGADDLEKVSALL